MDRTIGEHVLHVGDCRAIMADMKPESVDACITDPPYELTQNKRGGSGQASLNLNSPAGRSRITTGGGFMGLDWDASGVSFDPETWRAVARVLKPGAHLLAFGGTRTVHRIACAIEDAGFEIRDQIVWLYGQGFPKSLNIGNGWGTALKPAHEPIIVARKPFRGTVAQNVVKHGTGALNIDGCRIGGQMDGTWGARQDSSIGYGGPAVTGFRTEKPSGRWPANVCLDEDAAALLDAMSGERKTGGGARTVVGKTHGFVGGRESLRRDVGKEWPSSTGGASRFFYCAKASRAERNAGLDGLPERQQGQRYGTVQDARPHTADDYEYPRRAMQNHHPTVKPVALMRWLVRLVTPPGGLVLDPFTGSGSTGVACVLEGLRFTGIEREAEYVEIAARRIAHHAGPLFAGVA